MTIRELKNQEAQHVETGAVLRTHGRFAMQFELAGRVLTIPWELGVDGFYFYLGEAPCWDDGDPLDPGTVALIRPVIMEVGRFWKVTTYFDEDE